MAICQHEICSTYIDPAKFGWASKHKGAKKHFTVRVVIFASTCNEKQHLFKLYSYKKHSTLTDRTVCENSCLNAPLKKKNNVTDHA